MKVNNPHKERERLEIWELYNNRIRGFGTNNEPYLVDRIHSFNKKYNCNYKIQWVTIDNKYELIFGEK